MTTKLPLGCPEIRALSKFCSRQERELIKLRSEVASLRTAAAPAVDPAEVTEWEAKTQKLAAEVAAAKVEHAEFLAKEATEAPERARKQTEWKAEFKVDKRKRDAENARKRRARNHDEYKRKQKEWYHARIQAQPDYRETENKKAREKYAALKASTIPEERAAYHKIRNRKRDEKRAAVRRDKEQIRARPDLLQSEKPQ